MSMSSFYSDSELLQIGFKSLGSKVLISRKASIYSPAKMTIGDNVRIDDFCILSGEVTLGSHIHISAYSALYGAMGIILDDYTGISPRCTIFSAMDDFQGDYLIGPIHDVSKTNVTGGVVRMNRFSQIGIGSTVFPNVTIGEGCVVGAMSLVNRSTDSWSKYAGVPAKFIGQRKKGLLQYV